MGNISGNDNKNEKDNKNANAVKNDIFSKQNLLRFISRIIGSGIEDNIRSSLSELNGILRDEGADLSLLMLLHDVILASREMAELGESKDNSDVTDDELGKAIRKSRERIRREEAFRC